MKSVWGAGGENQNPGISGAGARATDPLTRLRRELPLRWSNYLPNSASQGEVDRGKAPERRGSTEPPLTPSVGFADSSP